MKFNNLKNSNRFRYGGMSVIFIVIFVAAVIVINLIADTLTQRFDLKMDITAEGIYEVSQTTKDLLAGLETPVTIHVMLSEEQMMENAGYSTANELMKKMVSYSGGNLTMEYVDILSNPTYAERFSDPSSAVVGSFIVQSDKRDLVLSIDDMYDTSYDFEYQQEYISGFQADTKFASAIHYVTTDELPKAVFVTGHGEPGTASGLNTILLQNSYIIETVQLMTEEIPEDTDLLIIEAPQSDFAQEEIDKLDAYLSTEVSNALIMAFDPNVQSLERLDRYMAEWGTELSEDIVFDPDRAVGGSPFMILPDYADNETAASMNSESTSAVIVAGARALTNVYETDEYRIVYPILQTTDAAYGKDISSGEAIENLEKASGDSEGPFPLVSLTVDQQYVDNQPIAHKVLFFATSAITDPTLLSNSAFHNSAAVTAMINELNPSVDAINIEPVEFVNTQLTVVGSMVPVLFVSLVVIIPIAFIVAGIAMFLKRRNR